MKINIMEKKGHLFSVVLRGFVGLCISRDMYIQGGQEVGRGYLLLGIHYRRIREHSTVPDAEYKVRE